jgi:uncharacterized membrane protein YadS
LDPAWVQHLPCHLIPWTLWILLFVFLLSLVAFFIARLYPTYGSSLRSLVFAVVFGMCRIPIGVKMSQTGHVPILDTSPTYR